MIYYGPEPRQMAEAMLHEDKPEPRPIIFEDAGPAADKHTATVDGAAAYDRQRSSREGDSA